MCCTYIYLWTLGGVGATFALWRHKYLHYLPFEIAFKHLAQTNVGSKLTCLQDVFSWEWVWEWVWFCTHGRAQLFNKNGIVKDMRNMRIVSWSAGPQRVLFSPSSWKVNVCPANSPAELVHAPDGTHPSMSSRTSGHRAAAARMPHCWAIRFAYGAKICFPKSVRKGGKFIVKSMYFSLYA